MAAADAIALRSLCDGRQVGAVIVNAANRLVSSGYNGPPPNYPTGGGTCSGWCLRKQLGNQSAAYGLSCPSVHAEANAIIAASRSDLLGGTIYATASCCADCAKLIASSGLARVVVRIDVRDEHRTPHEMMEFLRACGLRADEWNEEEPHGSAG